jgi:hypothetical protein
LVQFGLNYTLILTVNYHFEMRCQPSSDLRLEHAGGWRGEGESGGAKPRYELYPSFKALQQSAKEGCTFCQRFGTDLLVDAGGITVIEEAIYRGGSSKVTVDTGEPYYVTDPTFEFRHAMHYMFVRIDTYIEGQDNQRFSAKYELFCGDSNQHPSHYFFLN